jgi:competence protein ComEA
MSRAAKSGMRPAPAAEAALAKQKRAVDSARANPAQHGARGKAPAAPKGGRAGGATRPPATSKGTAGNKRAPPVFPIDVDRASAAELEALPKVGPSLALRIVAERDARGPFRSLDALDTRVKGIGPSLVKSLLPLVTFSGR